MSDIEWADPPQTALYPGMRGRYTEFIAALKASPDKWAILPGEKASPDSAKGTALNIRNGRMRGFIKGEFETAIDALTIYVRYVGPSEPEVDADGDKQIVVGHKAADVRAWGRENGFTVGDRGVLPDHLLAAFLEAQEAGDDEAGDLAP